MGQRRRRRHLSTPFPTVPLFAFFFGRDATKGNKDGGDLNEPDNKGKGNATMMTATR